MPQEDVVSGAGNPHYERLTRIVMDHLFYAKRNPDRLEAIATKNAISPEAAMAAVIADQIIEEFELIPRSQ